ncbi:hypothetical protein ACFFX1_33940 [Dactylosporangium sucinum]|uniref:hypothetical protein n=1 Tax=Dactylosporangium sucinum TaxID=1424081 RepID=UPI00167D4DE5|nr:hypothetical protein [Dactylosporangium sucinum]
MQRPGWLLGGAAAAVAVWAVAGCSSPSDGTAIRRVPAPPLSPDAQTPSSFPSSAAAPPASRTPVPLDAGTHTMTLRATSPSTKSVPAQFTQRCT